MISVKSYGSNINLHQQIIKLINAEKTVIKNDHGFDEVFNSSDEINIKRNKLCEYNPRTVNKINTKNESLELEYLKIMKLS